MAGPVASKRSYTSGQHSFAQIPRAEIPRSRFNRSFPLKTSFDSGLLIPVFVDEALPGDTMSMRAASFVRMTTPIFPVMDNIYLDYFFFSVPVRLVWDNWNKFNGEQVDPGDSTVFLVPQMTETPVVSSLSDYLGIPPNGVSLSFNSLWHRAYNLIFNEWFRDQNLTDSAIVDRDDGPDTATDYVLRRRAKRHDYFTSCLPFPQKGDPVQLPLGNTAAVISNPGAPQPTSTSPAPAGGPYALTLGVASIGNAGGADAGEAFQWANSGLIADLSTATASTINEIREAFQIQRLLERDARGGSRYTEIVRSHFGVVSDDARLQRPEYLGGGSTRVNVHPVARTNAISSGGAGTQSNGVGVLGAFATASAERVGFMRSFTEHCLLIGIVNVRADLTWQQGMERMFSRQTRYDFYWPALAHLGEQAVLNKELYAQGTAEDNDVFGYQERYAEYRYKPSRTAGRMRSQGPTPLDQWHLGIEFASLPLLNNTFIEDNIPFSRVLAIAGEPQFFGDFWFEYSCARPMPMFSVPGLIDHF